MKRSFLLLMMLVFTLLSVSVLAESSIDGEWTLLTIASEIDAEYYELSSEDVKYDIHLNVADSSFLMSLTDNAEKEEVIFGNLEQTTDTVYTYKEKDGDDVEEYAFMLMGDTLTVTNISDGNRITFVFVRRNDLNSVESTTVEVDRHTQVNSQEVLFEVQDYTKDSLYTSVTVSGVSCDEVAQKIGYPAYHGYTFIKGTQITIEGVQWASNETAENLWDNDVSTKFCCPLRDVDTIYSVVRTDASITVHGFVLATANDNAIYHGRNPQEWTIFVSEDGVTWNELAYGLDTFLEDANFTYYGSETIAEMSNINYVAFQCTGSQSGTFQLAEVVLLGSECVSDVDSGAESINTDYTQTGGSTDILVEPKLEPLKCSICRGTGNCQRCSGTGSVNCPDCHGGTCPSCYGACYTTKWDSRTQSYREINCSRCGGSGWCKRCYGMGTIDCTAGCLFGVCPYCVGGYIY